MRTAQVGKENGIAKADRRIAGKVGRRQRVDVNGMLCRGTATVNGDNGQCGYIIALGGIGMGGVGQVAAAAVAEVPIINGYFLGVGDGGIHLKLCGGTEAGQREAEVHLRVVAYGYCHQVGIGTAVDVFHGQQYVVASRSTEQV